VHRPFSEGSDITATKNRARKLDARLTVSTNVRRKFQPRRDQTVEHNDASFQLINMNSKAAPSERSRGARRLLRHPDLTEVALDFLAQSVRLLGQLTRSGQHRRGNLTGLDGTRRHFRDIL